MSLFYILVFPGYLFLMVFGLAGQYIDRILHARMQNRLGPPWFQPFADFIKLSTKEVVIPEKARPLIFKLMPVFAMAGAVTAFLYIPLGKSQAIYAFNGDLIVVIYLLTIPTLSFFLGGWFSTSLYSMIGAVRCLTQLFAYEVPLFMALLAPAMLANTWSLSEMAAFYQQHPALCIFNVLGFFVAIVSLLGKLEKVPFDIPDAETEIVGGTFTEYGGRYLALFRMALDIELIVGASLIVAVFLPFGMGLPLGLGFIAYMLKTILVIGILSLARTIFARLRIDQMIDFCWKYLAPIALFQFVIILVVKGVLGI